jgi:predicted metalloendopeptidase
MPVEVLGHVIAHEIGHVLEGVARHSTDGLMKPHWTLQDYWRMKNRHLFFAAEDVELMHLSMQRASAGSVTAQSERE